MRRRRWSATTSQGTEGDNRLPLTVYAKQCVCRRIGETENRLRRQVQPGGDGKDVREHCPTIPVGVAVRAYTIVPGIAPEGTRYRQYGRGLGESRLRAGSLYQDSAKIASAQLAQTVIVGRVMINAGWQVGQVTADKIQFQMIQCSSAA